MLSQRFFVNEEEEALAREKPKLFKYFCTLTTKLSFQEWLKGRQFVIDTMRSFDGLHSSANCLCSYYEQNCTLECGLIYKKKFVNLTDRVSSFTDEKIKFFDLMFLKALVDSCKTHSVDLAKDYLIEIMESYGDDYYYDDDDFC